MNAARAEKPIASFFIARWHGRVPVGQLLWRDMLLAGTAINVMAALIALLLFAWDVAPAVGLAVYLAPVPYNFFLFGALWRSSAVLEYTWAWGARLIGLLWVIAATLI